MFIQVAPSVDWTMTMLNSNNGIPCWILVNWAQITIDLTAVNEAAAEGEEIGPIYHFLDPGHAAGRFCFYPLTGPFLPE